MKTAKTGKNRDTHYEIITIIQVRDDGELDEDGGCRNEEIWLDSRCILKQVLTRCFDGLDMGCERKNRE